MHDDGTSGGPTRQVKVDNWGIFFLQRLQQFFNRSDHCDLTLQFAGNYKIKVHRLVLNACTEYFQALEKKVGRNKDDCLAMPADLSPDVVLPIINFMYTGRLEFRDSLTKKLYYTAGRLNMPVLTKLLDAQGASEHGAEPSSPTVSLAAKTSTPTILSKSSNNSYASIKKPMSKELPETLPGRKLPIWKKRRTPFMSSFDESGPAESAALASELMGSVREEEPARPTRFEWPEDEDALKSYVPPFDSITYESAPLQTHTNTKPLQAPERKPTFEDLQQSQSHYQPVKRHSVSTSDSSPKKSKMMDIQSVKEYLQEQEVRKQLVNTEDDGEEGLGEDMALGDVVDEDDDDDERDAETILPDPDDSIEGDGHVDEDQDGASSSGHLTKSILKQRVPEEASPGGKKVRFALAASQDQPFTVQGESFLADADAGEGSSDGQTSPANHAKIISEVLKKYPHLVRDNKNIRLRIMKQGTGQCAEGEQKNKKVSYVVLKAGDSAKNKAPAKVIIKTGGRVEQISGLVPASAAAKPVSGAENTTGPWLCFSCGTNEEPVNFHTYFLYRRHLQETHMEKIDARICEHCGHRASKRNLLLYHLFTKHNIPPPRNCQFPKCDQCEYVALSESLLIKHRNNHSNAKDFVCKVCSASFKSNGALQGHMQTNLHSDPDKKKYECPFCQKPFVRNINLKAHIRTAHKDMARRYEEEEQEVELALAQEANAELDPKKKKRREVLLLRGKEGHADLQHTIVNNIPAPSLEPSSEAEALSNVASGIAASLGLTDHQLTEVHEHQTVVQTLPGADGSVQTFIISAVPGQEYIVPEMLAGATGSEQYQIATTSALGELVQYDASALGSVVTSLGGVAGQQTIVITTANSEGHEQLKLISADGSTLDHVTLLSGQNLLVTNPDGTTSAAPSAEGYQAILQPNGVLTLQPMGTHVLQDGETVTEEMVQQGYVTQGGSILLAHHDDVHREQVMISQEDMDSKPFTLITSDGQHMDAVVDQGVIQEMEMARQEQLQMAPSKPRVIGTPIPIGGGSEVDVSSAHLTRAEHIELVTHDEVALQEAQQLVELSSMHEVSETLETSVSQEVESELVDAPAMEEPEELMAAEEPPPHEEPAVAQQPCEEQPEEPVPEAYVPQMCEQLAPHDSHEQQEALELHSGVTLEEQQTLELQTDVSLEQQHAEEEEVEALEQEAVPEEQGMQDLVEEVVEESSGEIVEGVEDQVILQSGVEEEYQPMVEGQDAMIHGEVVEGDDSMMQEEEDLVPATVSSEPPEDLQKSAAPEEEAGEPMGEEEGGGPLLMGTEDDQGALMIAQPPEEEEEEEELVQSEAMIMEEEEESGGLMIQVEQPEAEETAAPLMPDENSSGEPL